jgi:hypothetical protein
MLSSLTPKRVNRAHRSPSGQRSAAYLRCASAIILSPSACLHSLPYRAPAGTAATRKPMLTIRSSGIFQKRMALRHLPASQNQEPPRLTRPWSSDKLTGSVPPVSQPHTHLHTTHTDSHACHSIPKHLACNSPQSQPSRIHYISRPPIR